VDVVFPIGIPVVVNVMAHPPERPVLAGEGPREREDEPEPPARLERSVREEAMISHGETE
jgi:hypothetical protein